MSHLYLCPSCGRAFDHATIPDHGGRGCPYQGPGQRLTFTLEEAIPGIQVGILTAYTDEDAARRGREGGKPPFTVARVQFQEGS